MRGVGEVVDAGVGARGFTGVTVLTQVSRGGTGGVEVSYQVARLTHGG